MSDAKLLAGTGLPAAKRTPRSRLLASFGRGNASSARPRASTGSPLVNVLIAGEEEVSNVNIKVELQEIDGFPPEVPSNSPVVDVEATSTSASGPDLNAEPFLNDVKSNREVHIVNKPMPALFRKGTHGQQDTRERFDSRAFDSSIYQQLGTSGPPDNQAIRTRRTQTSSASSEEQRRYIHANPMIHLVHNRSDSWHDEKAKEIQERGGRKAWFGKVIERLRWLRIQRVASRSLALDHERPTPEPWSYNRPLDFGHVPESQLPEYVLRNENWRKACAWHREMHQARKNLHHQRKANRLCAVRDSEQKTQQFYQNILQSIQTGSET
ncbi:hypothetical protein HIM_00989 [Hirsutella minnesotensis 3608]|nr:hypothetical protein HIM_00989 [Hirsutella minnesotensis 3608]